MHDTLELEARGIPSVFVASDLFDQPAKVQAAALGGEPSYVLVEHPIQDRTDDEMRAIADAAAGQLVASLVRAT